MTVLTLFFWNIIHKCPNSSSAGYRVHRPRYLLTMEAPRRRRPASYPRPASCRPNPRARHHCCPSNPGTTATAEVSRRQSIINKNCRPNVCPRRYRPSQGALIPYRRRSLKGWWQRTAVYRWCEPKTAFISVFLAIKDTMSVSFSRRILQWPTKTSLKLSE